MSQLPDYITVDKAHGVMQTHALTRVQVRDLSPVFVDEPPSRGGEDRAPTPMEHILIALCGCTSVTTSRLAKKIRFQFDHLESFAEAELDQRGLSGRAEVDVHYRAVRLIIQITTNESDARLARLQALVDKYCPVSSFIKAAVANYTIEWQKVQPIE
ncbi:OsmC family protein [Candidatus Leptofilum sp.]|uniref:OsmC family protein n=1 Tax=Candidatus Leptofilum sp. TaxID=3241576 RepID=UPI003B5ACCA7